MIEINIYYVYVLLRMFIALCASVLPVFVTNNAKIKPEKRVNAYKKGNNNFRGTTTTTTKYYEAYLLLLFFAFVVSALVLVLIAVVVVVN